MKIYWEVLKEYRRYVILSPILVTGYALCETLQPSLMARIVDDGVMLKDLDTVIYLGVIMICLSLIAITLSISNLYCASKTSVGFSTGLRNKMFHKIMGFSFNEIDNFTTASLITRMTNDTTVLQQIIHRSMMLLFRAPLMMILAFFFVFRINREIAFFILAALPLMGINIYILLKKGFPLFIKVQEKIDNLNEVVRENLINIRVVKSYVREDFEKRKFTRSNEDLRDTFIRALNIMIVAMPIMQLVMNSLIVIILWIGGKNGMQVGTIISLVNYTTQILMALMMVSMTIMMFARASASSRRVLNVLNTESSIENTPKALDNNYQIEKGSVSFKDVCFKYDITSENCMLKDINFNIQAGENIAIVGATGSAKTTLLQLIPRLYDVTEGDIYIDGRNVKDYTLAELRDSVGMVLQKNELFSGTILSNLKWGDENATYEEVVEAAKAAEAHDFIMSFADKYETILGQSGVNVSGGQKQRLCIARALLKKPRILILDNSTSAVDTATEQKIRHNLKSFDNITVIMVTQRYTTMSTADRVIILDEGQVKAIGTPDELLQTSEIYQEIYSSQQLQS